MPVLLVIVNLGGTTIRLIAHLAINITLQERIKIGPSALVDVWLTLQLFHDFSFFSFFSGCSPIPEIMFPDALMSVRGVILT